MKLTIHTDRTGEAIGDLYGIFFEDINHAADGGLYGEMVQNGSFEYSCMDNVKFRPLTAWEKIEEGDKLDWMVTCTDPYRMQNPHHLVLDKHKKGRRAGIRNKGYNGGMNLEAGKLYFFSCFAKCRSEEPVILQIVLTDDKGNEISNGECRLEATWTKKELMLRAAGSSHKGRLEIWLNGNGRVEIDYVSLFPADTFCGRKNGMRKDIAEMLADMKPKFMRFPGGCLVHEGSLNQQDRDSMYRWKNTIGPLEDRPGRRNLWGYHQSLGIGYYEYFQFCEDIGAKPLPVLPAGYNPHSGEEVLLDEMGPWIQDALDLIEFANGSGNTKWGNIRTQLGHPEPFGLEYLAIGNEEVGAPFFERYALFHKAIRESYPYIKLINTAGFIQAGEAFEKGWESARENESDLIDEHYYQIPEWFLSNSKRYDSYQGKTKVFVGEYASCGNRWYNALAEAAFMTGLERNAGKVLLACYAPLLANADYINWTPDLIWFDNYRVYGSPSYYIQKLFMNHQGINQLICESDDMDGKLPLEKNMDHFEGKVILEGIKSSVSCKGAVITNLETMEHVFAPDNKIKIDSKYELGSISWKRFSVCFSIALEEEEGGFRLRFGEENEDNYFYVSVGDWNNTEMFIGAHLNGIDSNLIQKEFSLVQEHWYDVTVIVDGRHVKICLDGKMEQETECGPFWIEPLYYSASQDDNGDIIIKLVNASSEHKTVMINLPETPYAEGTVWKMEGFQKEDENSFEEPQKVIPSAMPVKVSEGRMLVEMPGEAVRVYRLTPKTCNEK